VLYPYEWPFALWKEAALTTLTIQQEALREGFWLRDATPFNLTLYHGRMCHFDQLSLEPYPEGSPWPAYTEFIRTFLAPLLLMSYRDRRLGKLIQLYPEGLPLDLVWKLLPMRGRWSGLGLLHLYPHKLRRLSTTLGGRGGLSMKKLLTLTESLYLGVESLKPRYASSPWEGYAGASCPYPHLRNQSCTQLTFNFSPLVSGRPYLCLMIWRYVDSDVGGLIWAEVFGCRCHLGASPVELFMRNMDKILIFRWLSWGRCRVSEGGLFAYRSRPCIRACITPGFSKTPLELIHIHQLPS